MTIRLSIDKYPTNLLMSIKFYVSQTVCVQLAARQAVTEFVQSFTRPILKTELLTCISLSPPPIDMRVTYLKSPVLLLCALQWASTLK